MVKIDDTDPKWQEIMNYFAPDLTVTHTGTYGKKFIRRLDNIKHEMDENNGVVQTYDIPNAIMEKISLPMSQNFAKGSHKIKRISNINSQIVHTVSPSAELI